MSFSRTMRTVPKDVEQWVRFFRDLQPDAASIPLSSIEQIASNSLIGNVTAAAASPAVITATVNDHVMRLSAGTLGFGFITSSSVSDFTEAAQDAAAAAITNGTGLSWAYNDAANTITGTVSLSPFTTTDLAEGTNLYFTDERAQDAVGTILTDSSRIDFTYTDATPAITADIVADSVSNTYLANMAQSTIKGRAEGAGTGDPTDLTATQVAAIIDGESISWSAQQIYTLVGSVNTPTILMSSTQPTMAWYETDQALDEKKWVFLPSAKVFQFRSSEDAASTSIIWMAITRGTGTAITNIALGDTTNNNTYTFGSTGTATFSGQVTGLRFVPTSSTAATNGLYLPAANTPAISTNSTLAMSWDSSQNALGKAAIRSDSATAGVGYTTGAGGTVTQATSRTTGVTLNKICGAITLVSAAGTASWQSFTVTNSAMAATDVVVINQKSGTDKNMIHITAKAAGSFEITFATTGGTTSEQPVFEFAIIKGVTA